MPGRFALALLASTSMLPVSIAAAQQIGGERIEEIIVTAQKREERLREVPQSVTALTDQTLQRVQANEFLDYVGRIPGMTAVESQAGNTRLTLRGLETGGVAATIGTYIDETPFGSSTALANGSILAPDLDPADIQRIEVLRGPQGTLYGASTLGGLIKFVTRDPSPDEFEGWVRASGEQVEGGEDGWALRGALNVPLGSRAAARLSGWRRSEGGFVDDPSRGVKDIDDAETSGARGGFLLNATENLTIRLSALLQDIKSDAASTIDYFPVPLVPVAGETDQTRLFSESTDTTYRLYNGTIDWDLGWASLISASSYNQLEQFSLIDSTVAFGAPALITSDLTLDKFTQEVRLTSPASTQFEWLAGVYYTQENAKLFQNLLEGPPPGIDLGLTSGLDSEYKEIAGFGTITYYFVPQFDVSVGARYSRNDQTAEQFGTAVLTGTQSSDDSVTTYSAAARWRPNEWTTVYGRVASGYRPGGPNVLSAFGTIPPTFEPDTAVNYEIGVKSDIIPGLLRLDAAVFRVDWDNIQLLVSDGVVSGNGNGGTARSQGVEWTATVTPVEGLTAVLAGAYTDAQLTSPTDPPGGLVLTGGREGDPLPDSPIWSSSLDIDYEWTAFNDSRAYVGGSWRYVGKRKSGFDPTLLDAFGAPQIELPSYHTIDLRAGVDVESYSVELYVKNLADKRTPLTFGGYGGVPPSTPEPNGAASVLRPRTIGLTLTARF